MRVESRKKLEPLSKFLMDSRRRRPINGSVPHWGAGGVQLPEMVASVQSAIGLPVVALDGPYVRFTCLVAAGVESITCDMMDDCAVQGRHVTRLFRRIISWQPSSAERKRYYG